MGRGGGTISWRMQQGRRSLRVGNGDPKREAQRAAGEGVGQVFWDARCPGKDSATAAAVGWLCGWNPWAGKRSPRASRCVRARNNRGQDRVARLADAPPYWAQCKAAVYTAPRPQLAPGLGPHSHNAELYCCGVCAAVRQRRCSTCPPWLSGRSPVALCQHCTLETRLVNEHEPGLLRHVNI